MKNKLNFLTSKRERHPALEQQAILQSLGLQARACREEELPNELRLAEDQWWPHPSSGSAPAAEMRTQL